MKTIDTNILVYAFDRNDQVKFAKARTLLNDLDQGADRPILLWQVLAEFVRYLRSAEGKGWVNRTTWMHHLATIRNDFQLILPTPAVLDRALELGERYSLSHSDSMLLGACIEAGVTTLHTEDMGSPTTIGPIQLLNPFV